ncbi:MAG TPA: VWA domain-containing protein [Turneriella sp.]|nr:VWA domain-containing protein [Turneriella sp.]
MRKHSRKNKISLFSLKAKRFFLCLFVLFAAVSCGTVARADAQGEFTPHRITGVKAVASGKIEVYVVTERAGDYENVAALPSFKLRENGVDKTIQQTLLPTRNTPSRTVLLADLSRSLSQKQFNAFKRASLAFVDRLKPTDTVALISFHHKVRRELNFTSDRELLKKRITGLKRSGKRTMLYEALLEAHKMLADAPPKKAIVLYTDGKENASRVGFADLRELFGSNPIPFFIAGKGKSPALKKLIRLARISGGDAFRVHDARDLAKVFHYLTRLRTQEFILSYQSEQKGGSTIDLELAADDNTTPLLRSYTIPTGLGALLPQKKNDEKLFSANLYETIRRHMPDILLALIILLLVVLVLMLLFRRQEITVKVENQMPQAFVPAEQFNLYPEKKSILEKAKLPLDYYHAWLVEKEGPHTGRKYKLTWHVVTLGFADDNSIVVDDNTISPRHAKIERVENKFVLYDLLSETGTYLNNKKLLRPKELNDFDEIQLGRTKLIFRKSAVPQNET